MSSDVKKFIEDNYGDINNWLNIQIEAMTDKQRIINDTKEVIDLLSDTNEIEKRINDATAEIEIVAGLVEKLVQENA